MTVLLRCMPTEGALPYHINSSFVIAPQMHIVTMGLTPEIGAHVVVGSGASLEKKFWASKAATTDGALRNLLQLTQKLLGEHEDAIGKPGAEATTEDDAASTESTAGSTCADASTAKAPYHARMSSTDKSFWDSETVTNASFHATGGWRRCTSPGDSGYDSNGGGDFLDRSFGCNTAAWNVMNQSFGSNATVANTDDYCYSYS